MRLDLTSLAFGYSIRTGGGSPNWATALGQDSEHKINDLEGMYDILKGMVYSSVPLSFVEAKIGKGGRVYKGDNPEARFVMASVFSKVYINNVLIDDAKFILLITKDKSERHNGRLRLKYATNHAYEKDGVRYSNEDFFARARTQLDIDDNGCWFIYELKISNQDTLKLKAIFVDKKNSKVYENKNELSVEWNRLVNEANANLRDEGHDLLRIYKRNRIFFGAPGTGKSHRLNVEKNDVIESDGYCERVTFHPDYSYANFVGTYKPVSIEEQVSEDPEVERIMATILDEDKSAQDKYNELFPSFKGKGNDGITRLPILLGMYTDDPFTERQINGDEVTNNIHRNEGMSLRKYVDLKTDETKSGDIEYKFVPGPFVRVLVEALKDPGKNCLLIIEEINRANVAAVFGDVFQLLDRKKGGESEYRIQASEDLRKYLAKELKGAPDEYSELYIPSNMFIWATMNSADQGVFPIDTAFRRRWDFTYVGIDDSEGDLPSKPITLSGKVTHWNALRKAINDYLTRSGVNEDKLLGPFFIGKEILESEDDKVDEKLFKDTFKDKVIMYLFEDAARQFRSSIFSGCEEQSEGFVYRYSSICDLFDKIGIGIFDESIRRDTNAYNV